MKKFFSFLAGKASDYAPNYYVRKCLGASNNVPSDGTPFMKNFTDAEILPHVHGSDHCPVGIVLG